MLKELEELIQNNKNPSPYVFDNYHGVRIPELRKLAKLIAKEKRYDFFSEKHTCFEEFTIHAFAIGYLKEDINYCLKLVKEFIPYIDNWSVNDSLCQNMKFAKTYQQEVFDFLKEMKDSNNEWEIRVIAVTFLSHFLNDKYIDEVIDILDHLNRPTYMAKMGIAWAYATIMAKYPEKMYTYLPKSSLDDWTFNKSICKMRESFRVKDEDKQKLVNMRRKKN
jgi:3-methyladenine DNA glycosylase AlkD